MAEITNNTHVLVHHHKHGMERILFVPPEGFKVPYGFVGSDGPLDLYENPELTALLSFLEVEFEPEIGETVEVGQVDETIHEPTLNDLQELMPTQVEE